MKRIGWYINAAALLFFISTTQTAHSTSYGRTPIYQTAETADLWVRATVIDSTNTQSRDDFGMDMVTNSDVLLHVIDSTDHKITGDLRVFGNSTGFAPRPGPSEVFVALRKKDDQFTFFDGRGVTGWIQFDQNGSPHTDSPIDTFWFMIQDLDYAVKHERTIPEDRAAYWLNLIANPDYFPNGLFIEFLAYVSESISLEPKISHFFKRLASLAPGQPSESDYALAGFTQHLFHSAIGAKDAVQIERLANRLQRDQKLQQILGRGTDIQLAMLLAEIPGEESVRRIRDMFVQGVPNLREISSIFTRSRSEDFTPLLWEIARDPVRFNITDWSTLGDVWEGLARRGDHELRPFLESTVLHSPPVYPPISDDDLRAARMYAESAIDKLVFDGRNREQMMRNYIASIKAGRYELIARMGFQLQDSDIQFLPEFVEISETVPIHTVSMFINFVVMRFPSVDYIPFLKTNFQRAQNQESNWWIRDLILALDRCGGTEDALQYARIMLQKPIPLNDARGREEQWRSKQSFVDLLSKIEHPSVTNIVSDYYQLIHPDTLREHLGAMGEWMSLEYTCVNWTESGVPALTRIDPDRARPALEILYEDGNAADQYAAALCLYALGDSRGSEYISAFRNLADRTLEGYADRLGQDIGANYPVEVAYRLNSPAVDDLVMERLRVSLRGDGYAVYNRRDFVERLGPESIDLLIDALQDTNTVISGHAFSACRELFTPRLMDRTDERPMNERYLSYLTELREQLE